MNLKIASPRPRRKTRHGGAALDALLFSLLRAMHRSGDLPEDLLIARARNGCKFSARILMEEPR